MPIRWSLILVLLLGSAGKADAARQTLRLDVAGQERRVLLFVPDDASTAPRPLVIVFHGRGDDATPFANAVKLHQDWPQAIVAYPRGELREFKDAKRMRGWQYRRGENEDRDLALTDRLLAELATRYGTRPETTYVAGFSNGGHFVFLLLKERNHAFAAAAILGAVQPDYVSDAPPKPLLYLFGRGEDAEFQNDWAGTVEALVRHNRTRGPLKDVFGCCKLQRAGTDGAPLVFGTYNAGHIWPNRGNEWVRTFFGAIEAGTPDFRHLQVM